MSGGAIPAAPVSTLAPGAPKIAHVVVVIQENRSVDNLFPGLPGADTVTTAPTHDGRTVALRPIRLENGADVDHSHHNFLIEYDHGKLDGFDLASTGNWGGSAGSRRTGSRTCPPTRRSRTATSRRVSRSATACSRATRAPASPRTSTSSPARRSCCRRIRSAVNGAVTRRRFWSSAWPTTIPARSTIPPRATSRRPKRLRRRASRRARWRTSSTSATSRGRTMRPRSPAATAGFGPRTRRSSTFATARTGRTW